MQCKVCDNQIENGSKFCSFCGTELLGQISSSGQKLFQAPLDEISKPVEETNLSSFTNAFLVIGLVNFGFTVFWSIVQLIQNSRDISPKVYSELQTIIKPIGLFSSIIILCLCIYYTKKKEHIPFFIILALSILAWKIYIYYIKVF